MFQAWGIQHADQLPQEVRLALPTFRTLSLSALISCPTSISILHWHMGVPETAV
jgi:hypothetical protein